MKFTLHTAPYSGHEPIANPRGALEMGSREGSRPVYGLLLDQNISRS